MTAEIIVGIISLLAAIAGALRWWYKDRNAQRDALARSAEALADAEIAQRQRELLRIEREREIAVPDPDGSRTARMLSTWPDRRDT